eukprot:TRINITY_DN37658_c0_g1_i1.p1 TRINITY_DN37658_c0_g1~~TRINITY_DN37658_c0_g1_i1.p1  ORF type:complete len:173 (+),score=34.42 TRINITY_DN37658_c0_g1_i1:84-602(+)
MGRSCLSALSWCSGSAASSAVRHAGNKGNGVFATKFIPEGAFLGKYRGTVLSKEQLLRRYPDANSPYAFEISAGLYIDSSAEDEAMGLTNYTRYINHSKRHPNVSFFYRSSVMYPQGAVIFEADKDIHPGEELVFDYGDQYWFGRPPPIEDDAGASDQDDLEALGEDPAGSS